MLDRLLKTVNIARMEVRHPRVLRMLEDAERSQWLPKEAQINRQRDRLATLLATAYRDIPFYRSRFEAAGLLPADIKTVEDLRKLPILTKDDIRGHRQEMVRPNHTEPTYENYTGGSTGEPMIFLQDHYYRDMGEALTIRQNRWAGWDFGVPTAILWGADRDIVFKDRVLWRQFNRRFVRRELFLNTFSADTSRLDEFVHEVDAFHPLVLIGYANSLMLFASYLRDRGIPWKHPLRGIVSAAETLLPQQREVIESVFGAPVLNRYASRDVGMMSSECSEHLNMHVCTESVVLEIIRPDGQAAGPGEMGEVIVTGLNNFAMPLIRYAIGDVAVAGGGGTCPCGRGLPTIRSVEGRTSDIIVLPNGRLVHGEYFTHLFYGRSGLKKFQVVQLTPGTFRIRLVVDATFDRTIPEKIRSEIVSSNSAELEIVFEYVDEIPPTRTGKHRYTISEVPLVEAMRISKERNGAAPM